MVDLSNRLTDELTDVREKARTDRNFTLSDLIRIELDKRGSFVFDTPIGQEVYHLGKGFKRADITKEFKRKFDRNV